MKPRRLALAKLTPPTLPVVLKRPRLFHLLDKSRARPLTWITAPPGAGKTTLVASYLRARRLPVCWYRLDESDADPSSFFHYLSVAAKVLAPRFRKPLPVLTPEYALGLPTFTRRYFQELSARLPRRCVLVLDNYQEIPATSGLHQVLAWGIQELPRNVSVTAISRQNPPPAMVKLETERAMALVGPEQVELSKAEAKALMQLQGSSGSGSPKKEFVEDVYRRVGGWAAGIVLALEHEKHISRSRRDQGDHASESIFQYLAGEVLERVSPDVQSLLLKTSLLPDITVPMAERLTNLSTAGEILASLHRGRYFTERRYGPELSYRYHPLFREFLLSQLTSKYELKEVQRLRQMAAKLLAEAGHEEDSIAMLREAEDWPTMSRQIIALAPTMLGQGRLATVDGWISSIPAGIALETPWLRFWHACSRMFINPSESQIIFEQVFEQFVGSGDQAGILLAWTNVIRCILFQWRGLPRMDRWIERFASLKTNGAPYPSAEIEAHVAEAMAGALVWRQPANPQTRHWLERAIYLNDRLTGSSAGHAIFLTESYLAWLGDFDGVRKGNERLWERASKPGAAPSMKIVYCLGEAMLGWIEGRVEDCRAAVQEGLSLGAREGIHLWDGWLLYQSVHNDLLSGDLETAQELLENVKRGPLQGLYLSQYCYHAAWYHLLKGNSRTALTLIEQAVEAAVQDGGPFPEALCCLLAASISQSLGDHQKAEAYRYRAATISEAMGSDLLWYGSLVLTAQFALDAGDRVKGLKLLRDAFAFGRKREMTEYPGWQAQAVARLCATALEEEIEVSYVQDLIRKRWLPLASDLRPAAWPWRVRIRTLGSFTIEIDGQPLARRRKAPHRLLDLLAAIIAFGGQAVPISCLTDTLWPEVDGDQAQENFKKSMTRLRKLLGVEEAILWQEGRISLNRDLCWVDALAFEAGVKQAELRARRDAQTAREDRTAALYAGPFLGLEAIAHWANPYREELRRRFVRLILRQVEQAQAKHQGKEAVCCLEQAIEMDPLAEPLYQELIPLLAADGRQAEATAWYHRCQSALARWADRQPSSETQLLLKKQSLP
jgi:LuxR family maltose regulon positive regulatory protein